MVSQNWKEQQNNWGIEKAYRELMNAGALVHADKIVTANPTFDWKALEAKLRTEQEQTRINVYFDNTEPPEAV